LPGIIVGGGIGRLYTRFIGSIFGDSGFNELKVNALLGATAMLSGYSRLTYSLTVVMLETTQSINLFVPMLVTLLASYGTGFLFNRSLYIHALRSKQVPVLKENIPDVNHNLRAKVAMKP
jgi:chloride channel 7